MIGVYVTFIRVVYGTMIYMSVPRWRFGTMSPGARTCTISIPLAIAGSLTGEVGFQLYRTRTGICLSYQQQAGIQGTPEVVMEQVGFQLCRTRI